MIQSIQHSKPLQFTILLIIFVLLYLIIPQSENNVLWRLPALIAGVPAVLNDTVDYLMFDWMPIEFYNEEIEDFEETALLRKITRSISGAILFCIIFIREILVGGVKTIVAFTSWDYVRDNSWAYWPALPWTVVTGGVILLGYALNGRWLAIFVGSALIYIAAFGQWEPAMETLSFVLIAAPVSVLLGLAFGVWAYKSRTVENVIMPLLECCANHAAFFLSGAGNSLFRTWRSCRCHCHYNICYSTDDSFDSAWTQGGIS